MEEDKIIDNLAQSLKQTKQAQTRLITRLAEVNAESDRLKNEIDAMQNSAEQTEAAIFSLLETMGSGKFTYNQHKPTYLENDYEMNSEMPRAVRNNQPPRMNQPQNNYRQQQQQQYQPPHQQQNNYPQNNYQQNNSVAYLRQQRNVSNINSNIEPISQRFADRTITQACTLLLKEANDALHVNDLYQLLQAGGMEFKGNNPTISIAVSLNRNRRFRKVAPGTFDLIIREAAQAS